MKVEIETLFDTDNKFSYNKMEHLCMICTNLQNSGTNVLMVSSGAIALGAARLGLEELPAGVTAKQATAAVGQAELIKAYQDCFDNFDQTVAQVLITNDVIENELRNKNARNTLEKLLEKGIIPVINENDSVSVDDIIMNDNYPLVLMVASLTGADAIAVNRAERGKFLLILRNSSVIHYVNTEELLELSDKLAGGKIVAENDMEGFPAFPESLIYN